MLKRFLFCLAALMLFSGVYAAEKSSKNSKAAKKVRKAAEKAAAKKESLEAIPGLPLREANWKGGPNRSWEINFNDAVMKAKAENKKLFVLRSGSDWCPPCKRLKSSVLGSSKFRKLADSSFVLVFLDFPRKIELPQEQKVHNAMVSKKFAFGGGVPSALIINPETLKVEGKIMGYKPAKDYINALKKYAPVDKKK